MAVAGARAALAAAIVLLLVAACGGGDPTAAPTATPDDRPTERVVTLENDANERFIFRLLDVNARELQITSGGVTTNFAYLPPLAETEIAIAGGVDLDIYVFVLIRGNDTLAFQQVSKEGLIDRGWRLTLDAGGFR